MEACAWENRVLQVYDGIVEPLLRL
jgi:hypothetical protein